MSGGQYNHFHIQQVANEIEEDFTTWLLSLTDVECTQHQRMLILNTVQQLLKNMNKCVFLVRELDLLVCGDTGPESFLERIAPTWAPPNTPNHIADPSKMV